MSRCPQVDTLSAAMPECFWLKYCAYTARSCQNSSPGLFCLGGLLTHFILTKCSHLQPLTVCGRSTTRDRGLGQPQVLSLIKSWSSLSQFVAGRLKHIGIKQSYSCICITWHCLRPNILHQTWSELSVCTTSHRWLKSYNRVGILKTGRSGLFLEATVHTRVFK